ncbi:DUF262 domain-containing protein [Micromonospora sp. WMMD975]|uniref:DUF262 domain-containing protein n=1 Tax=Micromonospora sp. WMMD975 TaxID=3016087 RepID=UPI00249A7B62|nr:DUF262 domain-containing protein [Micromonospora sp. WMMD975]WFE32935.1 DUF262 domain-containing protein [Micromonospora sp. WMMD975]
MRSGLDTQPTATTFDVERLVQMAWTGRIRVPHFQRDFRWTKQDVVRLFDSIVKGYPVGSLLLWVRPATEEVVRLGALKVQAKAGGDAFWVVDGQQRVTSLANALHDAGSSDPRFALAYNLDTEEFVSPPSVEDAAVVPLPVIFDLERLIQWFANHPEVSDRLSRATAVTRAIRQFEIPAYQVSRGEESVLRDIFDRMNNYGKRLSRAEVFSALFAGEETAGDQVLTIDRIAQNVHAERGFGRIDDDTVLRTILARRGSDVTRDIRNEFEDRFRRGPVEFPGERQEVAFREGEAALIRAVSFLQDVAEVPHFTMLPYRYLLIVLARFFAHFPEPGHRSMQLLRRWYWRAALAGPDPFQGSVSYAMRALSARIGPHDLSGSLQSLLAAVPTDEIRIPSLTKFRTNEGATRIALCCWWSQGPRSLVSGEPFDRAQLSNFLNESTTAADAVRNIVRGRQASDPYRLWAANRILLPTDDINTYEIDHALVEQPIYLDDGEWARTLSSHFVSPQAVHALYHGEVDRFLRIRQDDLHEELFRFLARMCEFGFEDTPPISTLEIEDLEGEADDFA